MERTTPKDWAWAYHVTLKTFLSRIAEEGLVPGHHPRAGNEPVLFVEPDVEGVEPYLSRGTTVIRFKTPGFETTEDGESVIVGGDGAGSPPAPFVGEPGVVGIVPPERIQVLEGKKFKWLLELE
jgi:hypothetical protein